MVPYEGQIRPSRVQVDVVGNASLQDTFLRNLALHTDGVGWVHLVSSLRRRGVWSRLAATREPLQLGALVRETHANLGYLNVALRVLDGQGWVARQLHPHAENTRVHLSPLGLALDRLLLDDGVLDRVRDFSPTARRMTEHLAGTFEPPADASLEALYELSRAGWGLPSRQSGPVHRNLSTNDELPVFDLAAERLARALDGNLLSPIAISLKQHYAALLDEQISPSVASLPGPRHRWRAVFALLADVGWLEQVNDVYRLTTYGRHAFSRAASFGVPVSYLPLFEHADDLLFGDAETVWQRRADGTEHLVDRILNVTSSGAAHRRYFLAADEVIRRAFDQPFADQPRGFCDMGAGDGAWLEHVWNVIVHTTERGRLMRAYPEDEAYRPLIVGADFNAEALKTARERLRRAHIPALTLFGDVNEPQRLDRDLRAHGIDARDLMHGNSFLIHNRPYQPPRDAAAAAGRRGALPGAYVWRSATVSNADLQQNLVEFMQGWRDLIGRHGLLVIELHDPERVSVGKTLTNYVMTHGFSNQFTVTVRQFLEAAAEAGLTFDSPSHRLYPAEPSHATVSVSYFTAGRTREVAPVVARPAG